MFKSSYRLIFFLVTLYPNFLGAVRLSNSGNIEFKTGRNSSSVSIVYPDGESSFFTRSYNLDRYGNLVTEDNCLYLSYSAGCSRSGDPDIAVDLNPGNILYDFLKGILDDYEQRDSANGYNSMGVD